MNSTQAQKHISHWSKTAQRNWKTAQSLFESRRYDGCLFYCHLVLEKYLKGLAVAKTKEMAPLIHDLEVLAKVAELELDSDKEEHLKTISQFNIACRYDDIKDNFYKTATRSYTKKYLQITENLTTWLKKQYPTKSKNK